MYRDVSVHTGPTRLFCIYRIHAARLHLYGQSREGGPVTKAYLIQPTHRSAIVRVTSCGARVSTRLTKTNFNSKHDWICANCIFSRNALSRRAYSALLLQATINDFLLLLAIFQYRSKFDEHNYFDI